MKKGIIMGKEQRSYEKNGETKWSRTLHVLWDKPNQQPDELVGQRVEAIFVRFPVDNVSVGDYVGVEYEPGFGGRADVVEVVVLGKTTIMVELPELKK